MADTLRKVLRRRFLCDDAVRSVNFDDVTRTKYWHGVVFHNGICEDPFFTLFGVSIFAIEITIYGSV